jgi:NADH-quinone oxidoreductase subunit C
MPGEADIVLQISFSISAVEYPENYEVVYHLVSYENNNLIEILVPVPKDNPTIESVVRVWKGANGHEREAYDMMGIIFKTHPDLRRILLPDDVDYHPLRKDFPLAGPEESWVKSSRRRTVEGGK